MVLVDPLFAPGDLSEANGARCPMRNTLLVAGLVGLTELRVQIHTLRLATISSREDVGRIALSLSVTQQEPSIAVRPH